MHLFGEFNPVSSKQWKQKIQFELKGADYQDVLWNSPEGISVRPFYHSDEPKKPLHVDTKASQFRICQDIFVSDVEKSIYRAKDVVSRGAESIRFTIPDEKTDIKQLLENLPLDNISVYLNLPFLSSVFVDEADKIAVRKNASVFCNIDPVGQLAKEGNWLKGGDNFDFLNTISKTSKSVSTISVNAGLYQNAGADIVQQIAYALAHVNEYFNRIPAIGKPVVFEVSVGTNYFFEIAKLRALRLLFKLIAKEYGHNQSCNLLVTPTKRNKTLYDYNVNMLRTTTECMSAILGGADAISNLPYDALYHKSNEFGERISRNQLLILKHESYFDKVDNPADGSYYIESLTSQLAEKALTLFKDIEANGGFLFQLGQGTIQRKIMESAEKEQRLFDSGAETLIGSNKHPNKNDRMNDDMELFPFVKMKSRKTLITPIIERRLAEQIEKLRLDNEKTS